MREILFRGKDAITGAWCQGSLVVREGERGAKVYSILPLSKYDERPIVYDVDPDTIGQYIGLLDRNDKKIFEGDIVNMHYFFENIDPSTFGVFEDEKSFIARISICDCGAFFEGLEDEGFISQFVQEPGEELEVIGNVYDNPELAELTKEDEP